MKKIFLFLISILFSSISFAQITREQADGIILQYIIDEEMRTDVLLLYTTNNLPNTEGISRITNCSNETFGVEYSCWVYYINEWMDANGPYFRRYLFVNKSNGNILEVKTRNDFGPSEPSLENWQLIYSAISEMSDMDSEFGVFYFPNPVNDFLEITCEKDFGHIAIFDLQGKLILQKASKKHEYIQKFDVSSLHNGLYIVNVFDTTKKVFSFKIFKK